VKVDLTRYTEKHEFAFDDVFPEVGPRAQTVNSLHFPPGNTNAFTTPTTMSRMQTFSASNNRLVSALSSLARPPQFGNSIK